MLLSPCEEDQMAAILRHFQTGDAALLRCKDFKVEVL
jgi:hypothetical protein